MLVIGEGSCPVEVRTRFDVVSRRDRRLREAVSYLSALRLATFRIEPSWNRRLDSGLQHDGI